MYAYLFYAVGAAFNQFFLLYVATFGLPLYALVFLVPHLDLTYLGTAMGGRVARVVAITYTGMVAAGLGLLWVGISLSYLVTDTVPQPIVDSGHPTGVVFAIDLVLIVPPMLLAALWLVGVPRQDVGVGSELPIWAGLTMLRTATVALLIAGIRRPDGGQAPAGDQTARAGARTTPDREPGVV